MVGTLVYINFLTSLLPTLQQLLPVTMSVLVNLGMWGTLKKTVLSQFGVSTFAARTMAPTLGHQRQQLISSSL